MSANHPNYESRAANVTHIMAVVERVGLRRGWDHQGQNDLPPLKLCVMMLRIRGCLPCRVFVLAVENRGAQYPRLHD